MAKAKATETIDEPTPVVTSAIRHWKPTDAEFTDEDRSRIADALGLTVDTVKWETVEHEIVGDVVGHTLIGSNF